MSCLKPLILCLAISLALLGCTHSHVQYITQPPPPPAEIEPPPELQPVTWVIIDIEGVRYYALSYDEAVKLITNIETLKEYVDRCYKLINIRRKKNGKESNH